MKILQTKSSEKLSRIAITICLSGLKIIGLAPFSLQHANNSREGYRFVSSKIGLVYNILLTLFVLVVSIFAFPKVLTFGYTYKNSTSMAIDITFCVLRTLTIYVVMLFGAFKQRKAISIMNRLLEVDRLLCSIKKDSASSKRTSFKILAVHVTINVLLWAILLAASYQYLERYAMTGVYLYNVPIFGMNWFLVEYSIALAVVAEELKILNHNLLNFKESSNDYNLPASESSTFSNQLATLLQLQRIRVTLSEVSQDIGDFFSFPTLAIIASFYLQIMYQVWHIFSFVLRLTIVPGMGDPVVVGAKSVGWVSVCVYPLILLCFYVGKTLKEAQRSGIVVHETLYRVSGEEIQSTLERFSLQLMHEDLKFTACGLFTLDFTLLQSIIGVTVTWLVITIQSVKASMRT